MEVVEVLPCAPATAMPSVTSNTAFTISERCKIVIPCSFAATISGLSSRIAVERTTASTPFTYSLL